MTDRIDTSSSLAERVRHLEMESKKLKAKPVDNTLDLKIAALKREIERLFTRDSISTVMHWTLTDTEITELFSTHSVSNDHDGRYYTEIEIGDLFSTHSQSGNHDGRYYTETEVDNLFSTHSDSDDHTQYAAAEGSSITRSAKHATKTTAISFISDTQPASPITGMVWIDTND